jgi:Tfp pilus assembly protein PilF
MKSSRLIILGLILLLGSGCQHLATPSLEMQQKFFSSLKDSHPLADQALRSAQYYKLIGRSDLALNELNQAITADPRNVKLLNAMGGCYDSLGQYAKAQAMYNQILAQDPDNIPARNNSGYSNYLSGDLVQAEKIFQEVLARQPNDAVARNNLGLVWCRQGKEPQALSLWRKNDGDIQAREKLDQVLAYLGKPPARAADPPIVISKSSPTSPAPHGSINQADKKSPPQKLAEINHDSAATRPSFRKQSVPGSNSPDLFQTAKMPPSPRVKVEEVKMVVHPASYSQALPNETPEPELSSTLPAPSSRADKSASGAFVHPHAKDVVLDDNLLQDDIAPPQPRYYRRPKSWQRVWKPKMVTCAPQEPSKPQKSMKNYVNHESLYQNQNTQARGDAVVF